MDKITDVKIGDTVTGEIGKREYVVEGDTVTAMWLDTAGFSGTLASIDADITSIDADIAIRQSNRALRVAMREALVAAAAPVIVPGPVVIPEGK